MLMADGGNTNIEHRTYNVQHPIGKSRGQIFDIIEKQKETGKISHPASLSELPTSSRYTTSRLRRTSRRAGRFRREKRKIILATDSTHEIGKAGISRVKHRFSQIYKVKKGCLLSLFNDILFFKAGRYGRERRKQDVKLDNKNRWLSPIKSRMGK
jgi:hypothetical protein